MIIRNNIHTFSLNLLFSILSACFLLFYYHKDITEFYPFIGNGEYINYSLLSLAMMGKYPLRDAHPWILTHQHLRCGQDIFVAYVSHLFHKDPWKMVILVSVFFRLLYDLSLFRLILEWIKPRQGHFLNGTLFLSLFYFEMSFPPNIMNFSSSWLSSNASIFLFLGYIYFLHTLSQIRLTISLLYLLLNVYFLMTYPEFWPFLKIAEIVFVGSKWFDKLEKRWTVYLRNLLFLNAFLFILNPPLIIKKVWAIYTQFEINAGWNIFGDPRQSVIGYIVSFFGFKYPYISSDPLLPMIWLKILIPILSLYIIASFAYTLFYRRPIRPWILGWLLCLFFFQILPFINNTYNWYGAIRFFLQTTMVIFVIIAIPLLSPYERPRAEPRGIPGQRPEIPPPYSGRPITPGLKSAGFSGWFYKNSRFLIFSVPLTLWLISLTFANVKIMNAIPEKAFYYPYAEIENDLTAYIKSGLVPCFTRENDFLWMFQLLAGKNGIQIDPLTKNQLSWLNRTPKDSRFSNPYAFQKIYEGLIIIDNRLLNKKSIALKKLIRLPDIMGFAFDILPKRVLISRYTYSILEAQVNLPSFISFPNTDWVTDEREIWVFLQGSSLQIAGDIPADVNYQFPFTFSILINGEKTTDIFSIPSPGFFSVSLDIGEKYINKPVAIRFVCPQYFVPKFDPRKLRFLLKEIRSD